MIMIRPGYIPGTRAAETKQFSTIGKAWVNERIIQTNDFIYIAGSSINFGININDHEELTDFP